MRALVPALLAAMSGCAYTAPEIAWRWSSECSDPQPPLDTAAPPPGMLTFRVPPKWDIVAMSPDGRFIRMADHRRFGRTGASATVEFIRDGRSPADHLRSRIARLKDAGAMLGPPVWGGPRPRIRWVMRGDGFRYGMVYAIAYPCTDVVAVVTAEWPSSAEEMIVLCDLELLLDSLTRPAAP